MEIEDLEEDLEEDMDIEIIIKKLRMWNYIVVYIRIYSNFNRISRKILN